MVSVFQAIPAADPAHYVRGQHDGYREIEGVASDSTTETYAALQLHVDNWRWSGVPFFIRTGKNLPATVTELRLVFKHPPRLGFLPEGTRRPEPDQLIVRLYPTTGIRLLVEAQRADVEQPEQVSLDLEFSEQGGEGATPYEVLLHAAMIGDSRRFKRQDSVEETWRIMQPLLDAPPPVHAYKKGSWGPRRRGRPRRRARSLARAVGVGMSATTEADAAERGRPLAVPADRRLRVPLRLPHERARGPGRLDRLAVRAALRLAQRVRLPARSPGRLVPAGPVRDQRANRPDLRAGDERPRHHVEDAHRLGPGARRPDDGPAARRGPDHAAHAAAGGRRRRPHAGAHGALPGWEPRDRAGLRARLRLRPDAGGVVAGRRGPAHRRRASRGAHDQASDRPRARHRGRPRAGTSSAGAGRPGLLRALLGRGARRASRTSTRRTRASRRRSGTGAAGSGGPGSPTTAGATRSSARRSRSRA